VTGSSVQLNVSVSIGFVHILEVPEIHCLYECFQYLLCKVNNI
jgi:hypothetical protein